MKVSIVLVRKLDVACIELAPDPTTNAHPLCALSLLSKLDAGATATNALGVYSQLKTAGFPSATFITDGGRGFGGINFITAAGKFVPFKTTRAVHRVGYGYAIAGANGSVCTPLQNGTFQPPSSYGNGRPYEFIHNLDVSSRYTRDGDGFPFPGPNQEFTLENNSYVSPNGQFSDVPGIAKGIRYIPNTGPFNPLLDPETNIQYDRLVTVVETLNPTNLRAGNASVGRVVGGQFAPVYTYGAAASYMDSHNPFSRAFISSQWDIEIDDVTVSLANETNESIYVIAAATGFQFQYNQFQQPAPSNVLTSLDSTVRLTTLPDMVYLCNKVIGLQGNDFNVSNFTLSPAILNPQTGTQSPWVVNTQGSSVLMAGVNVGPMDYVPVN